MNYLQLVNGVLMRMREDTVSTVTSSDPVVAIVAAHVNDAKRIVEDAHLWNAERYEWTISSVVGQDTYSLTDSGESLHIEYFLGDDGSEPVEMRLQDMKRKKSQGSANGPCQYFSPNGLDSNQDVKVELYPASTAAVTYTVGGHRRLPDLSADDDKLIIPSKPVLYLALAMSARERGEVGGQTAAEIFTLADTYLSDAIAIDAGLNYLDNIWMTV